MSYRLGIDIGTTSIKAVLYGEKLERMALASKEYKTYHPHLGYAEQDPDEVLQAFYHVMEEVLKPMGEASEKVLLLSFSSAMHSLILMGEDHKPLTRSIIWSDNRSVGEVEEFKLKEDWLRHYQNTGTPVHSMSPFFKISWFRKNTDLLPKTRKIIGIKEFILFHLTGEYLMDYSMASATGMFNIHHLAWDAAALMYLDLNEHLLPLLKDVTEKRAVTNMEFIRALGLSRKLEIMIGASDGCLVNLGSGALLKGETTLSIGTSGALRMTVEEPMLDEKGSTFCYYLMKGKWVIGGAVNNGGNVVDWMGQVLFEQKGGLYRDLNQRIDAVPAGSDGLLFIPYLHGERAPHWDGRLTASYACMSAFHDKNHFVRATLEGIVFNMKEVWETLAELSGESSVLIVSGGFLKSEAWTRILSDVFGKDLVIGDAEDSSCLGAVLLDELAWPPERAHVETVLYDRMNHEQYLLHYERYLWYSKKIITLQSEERARFGERI